MDGTRVLIVEDERDIAELVRHALLRDGHRAVDVVTTGDAALRSVSVAVPDLVILDLNLPTTSGFEVCRQLRGRPDTSHVPIIVLTARTSESDRVRGLDLGADDYVTKPFSLRELSARVRAVLRRRTPGSQNALPPPDPVHRGRHLMVDFDAILVEVDGRPVRLTRREYELLECLVKNPNRVLSRDRLLEKVWRVPHHVDTRSVDVHIGRLRGKLGSAGAQIETLVGLGYRFVE
ncbi:MAG: response regulator transcription factor [Acidobacteriota bacterium]